MATNDFLIFSGGAGSSSNTMTQANYSSNSARVSGVVPGVADPLLANKAWRQGSTAAALLGQFIADYSGQNAVDDGTISTLEANFAIAINALVSYRPVLSETGSGNSFVISPSPSITSRAEGQIFRFKASHANTGASTLNDGLGAVPLVGGAHSALQGGDIVANGDCWAQWNSSVGGSGSYILLFCTGAAEQVANATQSQHAVAFGQLTGVVGTVRNLKASQTAAGTSLTFTADELILETALGGLQYKVSSLNKTFNGSSTGAGGMDTGSLPTSGYVAIYAIYNPTTSTVALLGTNATSAAAGNVYSGANMPAGYTASALISVWPTNSSAQMVVGFQQDRQINLTTTVVLNSSTPTTTVTPLSIATAAPLNAVSIDLGISASENTAGSATQFSVFSSATLIHPITVSAFVTGQTMTNTIWGRLPLLTPQTLYYSNANTNPTSYSVAIHGYAI